MEILLFLWTLKRYENYELVLSQHFSLIFRFYWLFFWVFVLNFVSFVHNFANFSSFFIRILLFSWVLKRYEKYELYCPSIFPWFLGFIGYFFWVFVLNIVSFVHNFANFSSFFIRILLFSWVLKRYEKYELVRPRIPIYLLLLGNSGRTSQWRAWSALS
jgi:predicted DNA-binding ribbon-helix-helix protein